MSYPHLSPETANECSRAAYDYDPACYCAIHWVYADYLPRPQYCGLSRQVARSLHVALHRPRPARPPGGIGLRRQRP